jgi:hypothetical protein
MAPEALSAYLTKPSAKEVVEGLSEALAGIALPDDTTFVAVFLSELV